ncbi:MAG: UDP-N-acetylmuramate--L-alanine ligase [Bacteroidales bacterium]|nr:MAG: UDP-N-acetylmuramate--L-alanine ligase [Bacteroidales bacterium]
MTNYYFLGIGGIGMSAIARYFHHNGYLVGGYDKVCSQLCMELQKEGIDVHFEDLGDNIDIRFKDPKNTIIIYTPAVPNDLSEFEFFRKNNFKILKRAQILGEITQQAKGLCVAGTHGKTTTSTMVAHLLKQSSVDCSGFLGGVSLNYNSNILLSGKSDFVVIEADEYDRSFHTLSPHIEVITSTDADHLDIYHSHEQYIDAFEHFTSLIESGGALIYKKGITLNPRTTKEVKKYSYSSTENADFCAKNIRIQDGKLFFDFTTPNEVIADIELGVPILVNVENAVAAMAVAWLCGATTDELRIGISSYRGVRRRFEKHTDKPKIFIDDYAHHPKELALSIKSVKMLYEGKKVLGVFQPHLYSRTKDFCDEFANALNVLDEIILLDIYPAREEPIEGVSSKIIYDKIENPQKDMTTKNNLLNLLKQKDFDVLLTLGAGDIDLCLPKIKAWIEQL